MIALRRGDRRRAQLELADTALAICREHGMGHIGPWLLRRPRAGRSPIREARRGLLEEGERQLALGCVSHNHL